MRIKVRLETGIVGGSREDVLEMDDTATDKEIEEEVNSWAWNYLELIWERE